ncbi:MAG TPA: hypothetical protein VIJ22_01935 [Polyangiaceae bacterium]
MTRLGSIDELYPYALAEGEGVGTAYEYVAKARFFHARLRRGARVLVAGLPERYGTSLDFAILAHRAGAELLVVDERAEAIERARRAIAAMQADGRLAGLEPIYRRIASLDALVDVEPCDAVLSCEVLQRVPSTSRRALAATLRSRAPVGAVFVPNGDNESHVRISGLDGLSRRELESLFDGQACRFGYVDMPPFPPGIARTAEQRTKAATGVAEALGMRALDVFCAAEPFVPTLLKRHLAHIVCVAWGA